MAKRNHIINHPRSKTGTGLYRQVFVVEVLSNEPLSHLDLEELHNETVYGGASGSTECIDMREISAKDMAKLLEAQGSDPSFLIDVDSL